MGEVPSIPHAPRPLESPNTLAHRASRRCVDGRNGSPQAHADPGPVSGIPPCPICSARVRRAIRWPSPMRRYRQALLRRRPRLTWERNSSEASGSQPADPATAVGPAFRGNRVYGRQAVEYVIRRAGTQLGVPYSWGGGSLTGPSRGVDSGAGTVGFDCSGLTRYAFAGVGVLLPRYSGDQYAAGRQLPPSQAKRGDLLFWGPGGGQHEALYLGGGQMIEAQQTGVPVKVSPVRTSGMTPYVTRVIEY